MTAKERRYEPRGMLAIEPRAFGMFFGMGDAPVVEVRGDGTAIVSVRGPLMHHGDSWGCFDSYDAIKARVLEALSGKPKAIVLSLDSPGGLVSGCFETAREIRAACAGAGVPLYAYVDGKATSAAYALACAAEHITAPEAADVGSIGVITELVDVTAANERFGIGFRYATSGARKLDGNPNAGISDGAFAAAQKQVDYLAGVFFRHVADLRGGVVTVDSVRALEAGIVSGADAMTNGLVDDVASLDELLATIASGAAPQRSDAMDGGRKETTVMANKAYDEAIAALRKAAEGDDETAKKAKRMLKAELAEDDAPAKDDDEGKTKGEDGDEPPADDKKKKDDEATARAVAGVPTAAATKDDLAALRAEIALKETKAAEAVERTTLLASRPDFSAEQAKTLATASIEIVRDAVKNWPRGPARKPAAAATATATRGEGQENGDATGGMDPDAKRQLDVSMGLATEKREPKLEGTRQIFPVMTRAQSADWLERRKKSGEEATTK